MLWILLWESVNDPGVRARIRQALGFCAYHTLRLCQVAEAEYLGMTGPAVIFADVVAAIRKRLEVHHASLVADALCLICADEQEMAQVAMYVLLRDLHHPRLSALVRQRGLCQPHYFAARTRRAHGDAHTLLRKYQEVHLDRCAALLPIGPSRAIALAGATVMRGEGRWPPARASGAVVSRRGSTQQATHVAMILRDHVSCPICLALVELQTTPHQVWLNSLLTDSPERAAFITAGGICRGHARALDGLAPEAVHELYARTWTVAQEKLAAVSRRPWVWGARYRSQETASPPCLLCIETERVAHGMAQEQAYNTGAEGLPYCLPHLRLVMQVLPHDRAPTFKAQQAYRLGMLVSELNEMERKRDWQYRHEPKSSEQWSWARAAAFFAGPLLILDPA